MIKIILIVAILVLGLVGMWKTGTMSSYQYDDTSVPAIVFIVSLIIAIAGSVCLGMAFASY